jgi:deoxyribodipyrimidine photo-lyase
LRLADHPALAAAIQSGRPVVCLFVLEEQTPGLRGLGGAARWWLDQSLRALDRDLRRLGGNLVLRRGPAPSIVPAIAAESGASAVSWNRRYDQAGAAIDAEIAERLAGSAVASQSFPGTLLFEPGAVKTAAGLPFAVYTPFWRRARQLGEPRPPLPAPARIDGAGAIASDRLDDWKLAPTAPDWAGGLRATWMPGEAGGRARAQAFLEEGLAGYAIQRDRPDRAATSRLSPHLRFGEVSARQLWHAAHAAREGDGTIAPGDVDKFLAELGWREFAYHLLHHHPDLATRNFQPRFDGFAWTDDVAGLRAWQSGATGYPIVDAGMRELWATGWMHNRVRMIAASFLVKHLLLDWRLGEAWFWDTLVDADPANNPAGWQWVAGSGADAAPYFRIFNPVLQGQKFDPAGAYVRHWVPELARLPAEVIHAPWQAGAPALAAAGITLGYSYPRPIVDHQAARARALASFASLKPAVAKRKALSAETGK